jgi:hypothetical protein
LDREVAWTFESAVPYSGRAFGTIGDINGDGYADIAVGVMFGGPGEAHGFFGSADGPSLTPDWSLEGNMDLTGLGASVGAAGDTNGDGYDDVIVGSDVSGRVYYHLGSGAKPRH